jgi:hypothetical protein
MRIAVVVYLDDMRVFRVVYPVDGDPPDVLDDPKWWDAEHCEEDSCPCFGLTKNRPARIYKGESDDPSFWAQFSSVAPLIDPRGVMACQ